MKQIILIFTALIFCSCKSLPSIQPFYKEGIKQKQCFSPFPEGSWQFIHSIEAKMTNRKTAFITGVTNINSRTGKINTVMMTIEGLVLFDAEYDKQIRIHKSISPFDTMNFAAGLMKDVKLIFFHPQGELLAKGYTENGFPICRYHSELGIVDIVLREDDTWEIREYDPYSRLIRCVKADSLNRQQANSYDIPEKITLVSYGKHEYILILSLIKAKQLTD